MRRRSQLAIIETVSGWNREDKPVLNRSVLQHDYAKKNEATNQERKWYEHQMVKSKSRKVTVGTWHFDLVVVISGDNCRFAATSKANEWLCFIHRHIYRNVSIQLDAWVFVLANFRNMDDKISLFIG